MIVWGYALIVSIKILGVAEYKPYFCRKVGDSPHIRRHRRKLARKRKSSISDYYARMDNRSVLIVSSDGC